jgi:predicted ATPase/DNA-binding SARP family transcriptional activator
VSEAGPRWRIELLGGLRATREGRSVSRFRTHKAEALLGVLAFRRDRAQPRELLTEMLWPDSEPAVGRNNLSRELSSLRHQLEPPGVPPGAVIVAGRTTIQLDPAAVTTDVAELEEWLGRAARASGRERAVALGAALALHAGDLLPGHYQDWLEPERARLRRAVLRAARELGDELARAGDLAGALEARRRATEVDPLSEEAHRELMALHAASGEPGAALRVHADFAARIERELGAPPSAATSELARTIGETTTTTARASVAPASPAPVRPAGLASVVACAPGDEGAFARHDGVPLGPGLGAFRRPADALACALAACRRAPGAGAALDTGVLGPALEGRASALLAIARPGTVLVSERTAPLLGLDLGADLRLVDVGRFVVAGAEERLLRLEGSGLATDDPTAGRVAAAALPLELTRFFGREAALAELRALLRPGATRLVTLTGPGGIGKTRLALELARELAPAYRGSTWFVPLAAVTDAGRVAEAVGEALGLDRPAGLDEVARALDGRGGLLVLDNLEQLGDAAAPVVRELLERAPAAACLATSRRRLGIAGEREHALEPLPEAAGVELFVDRARAVRPDFELTPANAAATAELVRRLDGIPLALTLAAGRAQVLSPAQLLERLDGRFALLATRSADVPERHRTLAAALAWSTDLLPEERRRLFARLTVFRGPFTLEAAEAVAQDPLVLDALSELRECSLLLAEGDARGGVLFRLLDTLRELTAQELALGPDERVELERRHAAHYLALATEAEPRLHGQGGRAWFLRLAAEYPNLRVVLERGATTPALAPIAMGLARALRSFWFGSGPARDVTELLPPLLAAAPERTADRAAALWALGVYLSRYATVERSRPILEETLATWRALGNGPMATGTVLTLGEALSRAGDDAAARARYQEGLALARAAGDVRRLAWGLGAYAQHLYFQGELELALPLVEESVALNESLDVPQHAIEQWRLAQVLQALGEGARAEALAARALETLRGLGFEDCVAQCRALLGRARAAAGDLEGARALLAEALAGFRKGSRPDYLAEALLDLAAVAVAARDVDAARAHHDECARLVRGTCEHLFLDRLSALAGDLARLAGDAAGARACYEACLAHVEARRGWGRRQALRAARDGLAALDG